MLLTDTVQYKIEKRKEKLSAVGVNNS